MSENKKGKKRSKSYYIKCAGGGKKFKHANDLAAGMKGFLVTCNKYEKETVREMYNILNEYADQMYGQEVKCNEALDNDSEEEDMEKAMAKETSALKQAANTERRFQNTDTKAKNCIFIRTTVESPCDLAHKIFTDIIEKQVQKARYALRMLPISVTCKTNMDNIKAAAEDLLKPFFETEFGVGLKYTSVCKIRNNQSVSRTVILPTLGKIIQELNPLHKLCHDDPELVIIVEVIRNVCCMSVVKDYFNFKKYNLHEVLKKPGTQEESKISEEGRCPKVESQTKEPIAKTLEVKQTITTLEKQENKEGNGKEETVEVDQTKVTHERSTDDNKITSCTNDSVVVTHDGAGEKGTASSVEQPVSDIVSSDDKTVQDESIETIADKRTVDGKENVILIDNASIGAKTPVAKTDCDTMNREETESISTS